MAATVSYDYGELRDRVLRRDGPADAMHIIEKQTIKKLYAAGAMKTENGYRAKTPSDFLPDEFVSVEAILMDARNVAAGFRWFHTPFDGKRFKFPRAALPQGFWDFVSEWSLEVEAEKRVA